MTFALGGGAIDPLLEFSETHHIASRFQAHAHFVPIIGAIEHEAVDTRADQAAENRAVLGDQPVRNVIVQDSDVILLELVSGL